MKKLKLLVLALIAGSGAYAQTVFNDYTDGKIYVRVKQANDPVFAKTETHWSNLPLTKFPFLSSLSSQYGISKVSRPFFAAKGSDELLRTYVVEFTNKASVLNLIHDLEHSGSVELAEKVPLMKTSYTPNDPTYNNGTQTSNNWHLIKIGAAAAWTTFHGNSTVATVAVVDNAMQTTHPDLTANIWVNPGETAG